MITIEYKFIKAALLFAAKKDVHSYLNGICFHKTKTKSHLVAMDGYRMIVIDAREAMIDCPEGEWIIPRDALEKWTISKYLPDICIEFDERKFTIRHMDQSRGGECIDGKYPDYARVVPCSYSGRAAQFNSLFLADCDAAARILAERKKSDERPMTAIAHNGQSAALVSLGRDDCFAIGMPIKVDPATEPPEFWTTVHPMDVPA